MPTVSMARMEPEAMAPEGTGEKKATFSPRETVSELDRFIVFRGYSHGA